MCWLSFTVDECLLYFIGCADYHFCVLIIILVCWLSILCADYHLWSANVYIILGCADYHFCVRIIILVCWLPKYTQRLKFDRVSMHCRGSLLKNHHIQHFQNLSREYCDVHKHFVFNDLFSVTCIAFMQYASQWHANLIEFQPLSVHTAHPLSLNLNIVLYFVL